MRVPSAQLQLSVRAGQSPQVQSHPQFGTVTLDADGRLDQSFLSSQQGVDFHRPEVAKFLAAAARESVTSYDQARANWESGVKADPYDAGSRNDRVIDALAKETGLTNYGSSTTDWRGVLTHAGLSVQAEGLSQRVDVTNQGGQLTARIESTNSKTEAVHVMSAPLGADGSLDLSKVEEKLTLNSPWLHPMSLSTWSRNTIIEMSDPRLERIAEAADLGYLLTQRDLGEGWKCTGDGNSQTWRNDSEELLLNPADHSFTLRSSASHTGHAGSSDSSCDYDVSDAVTWKNGVFQRTKA